MSLGFIRNVIMIVMLCIVSLLLAQRLARMQTSSYYRSASRSNNAMHHLQQYGNAQATPCDKSVHCESKPTSITLVTHTTSPPIRSSLDMPPNLYSHQHLTTKQYHIIPCTCRSVASGSSSLTTMAIQTSNTSPSKSDFGQQVNEHHSSPFDSTMPCESFADDTIAMNSGNAAARPTTGTGIPDCYHIITAVVVVAENEQQEMAPQYSSPCSPAVFPSASIPALEASSFGTFREFPFSQTPARLPWPLCKWQCQYAWTWCVGNATYFNDTCMCIYDPSLCIAPTVSHRETFSSWIAAIFFALGLTRDATWHQSEHRRLDSYHRVDPHVTFYGWIITCLLLTVAHLIMMAMQWTENILCRYCTWGLRTMREHGGICGMVAHVVTALFFCDPHHHHSSYHTYYDSFIAVKGRKRRTCERCGICWEHLRHASSNLTNIETTRENDVSGRVSTQPLSHTMPSSHDDNPVHADTTPSDLRTEPHVDRSSFPIPFSMSHQTTMTSTTMPALTNCEIFAHWIGTSILHHHGSSNAHMVLSAQQSEIPSNNDSNDTGMPSRDACIADANGRDNDPNIWWCYACCGNETHLECWLRWSRTSPVCPYCKHSYHKIT